MKEDKFIGVILILCGAFMYTQTLDFPAAVFGTMGAGFFPKILFTLLALSGVALTVGGWIRDRNKAKEMAERQKAAGMESWKIFKASLKDHSLVIISFFFVFGYILFMEYFGYLIATLLFMLTLMWFLAPKERKRIPMIIIVSCAMTFIIYFSFQELLQIFLPEGIFF
ncbi:MAG: tripartite tricarboxylate transporter TctB family protein [Pseudomonadota bacterium]